MLPTSDRPSVRGHSLPPSATSQWNSSTHAKLGVVDAPTHLACQVQIRGGVRWLISSARLLASFCERPIEEHGGRRIQLRRATMARCMRYRHTTASSIVSGCRPNSQNAIVCVLLLSGLRSCRVEESRSWLLLGWFFLLHHGRPEVGLAGEVAPISAFGARILDGAPFFRRDPPNPADRASSEIGLAVKAEAEQTPNRVRTRAPNACF